MGITGVGYQNSYTYYGYYNNSVTGTNDTVQNLVLEAQASSNIALQWSDGEELTGTKDVTSLEGNMTSGIIGLWSIGEGENYRNVTATYADNSTTDNPIINIKISDVNGNGQTYEIKLNEVNLADCTQMELFASCANIDAKSIANGEESKNSYMSIINDPQFSKMLANNAADFATQKQGWYAFMSESEYQSDWGQYIENSYEKYSESMIDEEIDEIINVS
ncbi:hypothetical protein C8E03_10639 [Lachnotalea glycerini]|uniref:Uncharacterized protein n=1 Tax=Lachnotalea glycerini TaxID=1763509 RepID=A0A255IC64_9FIRM|nr:hypothetical protein [Lachnotalea glycerini]PXV89391.1 hypothetical protein C8E03_10639 [Lachnotalea glycerini]RDY32415.1 hypothetical protein CG710_005405 [Lachnotalea glycerini]